MICEKKNDAKKSRKVRQRELYGRASWLCVPFSNTHNLTASRWCIARQRYAPEDSARRASTTCAATVQNYDKGFMSFSAATSQKEKRCLHERQGNGSMSKRATTRSRELSRNKAVCFTDVSSVMLIHQGWIIFPLIWKNMLANIGERKSIS